MSARRHCAGRPARARRGAGEAAGGAGAASVARGSARDHRRRDRLFPRQEHAHGRGGRRRRRRHHFRRPHGRRLQPQRPVRRGQGVCVGDVSDDHRGAEPALQDPARPLLRHHQHVRQQGLSGRRRRADWRSTANSSARSVLPACRKARTRPRRAPASRPGRRCARACANSGLSASRNRNGETFNGKASTHRDRGRGSLTRPPSSSRRRSISSKCAARNRKARARPTACS